MTRSHPQGRQQPWSAAIRQFATDAATAFVVKRAHSIDITARLS